MPERCQTINLSMTISSRPGVCTRDGWHEYGLEGTHNQEKHRKTRQCTHIMGDQTKRQPVKSTKKKTKLSQSVQ